MPPGQVLSTTPSKQTGGAVSPPEQPPDSILYFLRPERQENEIQKSEQSFYCPFI